MHEFLSNLFSSAGFMPHGHCYLWKPGVVWLHLISDALIVLAYYSIPLTLLHFVRKRKDLAFHWMFICFAVFIVACGTTHLMEILNIWHPYYWLSGSIKALTAVASVPTAILLVKLVPQGLALPSPAELRRSNATLVSEILERKRMEEALLLLNENLEHRVLERTAELDSANQFLRIEIQQRRQSEAKFKRFYDSNVIGVMFWDAKGQITDANDRFLQMVGYTQEDLRSGKVAWKDMTPPEYASLDQAGLAMIAVGGSCPPFEKEYFRKDGSRVSIVVGAAALEDSTEQGVCFVLDITERKQAEAEIHRLNQELEARVLQRTAELIVANQELEAFSYSVSHDLRAPLRQVVGYANLLQTHAAANLGEKAIHYLTTIKDSATGMGRLIDDLIEFSRMNRLELQNTPVELERLVEETIQDFAQEISGRDIVWKLGPMGGVQGDRAMLRLALCNLIGNAIKYTGKQPKTVIEIGRHSETPLETIWFIRDNGAGFDAKYADKLFGVFQRLHQFDEFEGTGIGLANVRRIIHRHGGRTWAEGKVNEGATFYFSLPKREEKTCLKSNDSFSEKMTRETWN
ncbi:MAG: Sensory box histidine kinase [Verrucomicrobiales bacterium]|nr:Sensory box histidine kinase [Verrucomicrobiales bacterium]